MKTLILDSGTIINFAMNGLLYIFEEIKKNNNVKMLITNQVKYETIDRPIGVPRFELEALRIKSLLDANVIEMPESVGVQSQEIEKGTKEFMEIANHIIKANNAFIKIVSEAEMSCLALSKILSKRKIENIIAIDERTTRLLSEKPENLEKIMSDKLHHKIILDKEKCSVFSEFKFIRSTEIAYVAYKKGFLKISGPKALEAALYATKFKGSSVSFEEINELKKL